MERDGYTRQEAEEAVISARKRLNESLAAGHMPFDFCAGEFGLEPDYLEMLI